MTASNLSSKDETLRSTRKTRAEESARDRRLGKLKNSKSQLCESLRVVWGFDLNDLNDPITKMFINPRFKKVPESVFEQMCILFNELEGNPEFKKDVHQAIQRRWQQKEEKGLSGGNLNQIRQGLVASLKPNGETPSSGPAHQSINDEASQEREGDSHVTRRGQVIMTFQRPPRRGEVVDDESITVQSNRSPEHGKRELFNIGAEQMTPELDVDSDLESERVSTEGLQDGPIGDQDDQYEKLRQMCAKTARASKKTFRECESMINKMEVRKRQRRENEQHVQQLRQNNSELQEQIARLEGEIGSMKTSKEQVEVENTRLKSDLQLMQQNVSELQEKFERAESEAESMKISKEQIEFENTRLEIDLQSMQQNEETLQEQLEQHIATEEDISRREKEFQDQRNEHQQRVHEHQQTVAEDTAMLQSREVELNRWEAEFEDERQDFCDNWTAEKFPGKHVLVMSTYQELDFSGIAKKYIASSRPETESSRKRPRLASPSEVGAARSSIAVV